MLSQTRASRLKTFALVTAACAVALPVASWMMWTRWDLAHLARVMGLREDPVVVGLVLSIVPAYIAAIEIWLPLRRRARPERQVVRAPLTDSEVHWNAVRIVAVACILVVELVAQSVPQHHAAHAAVVRAR